MLCLLPAIFVPGQTREFKLASYNSLRYSPTNIDARHPHFRAIFNEMQPNILVLEELSGSSAATMFLDSVLNVDSSTYALASFIDGNDLDVALFYKTSQFASLPTLSHPTALRDIFQFWLIPNGSLDTLHIFGVHLKASGGSTNEAKRADEVNVLRGITNSLRPQSNFLVCGDFNFYGSSEPGYQDLMDDTPGDDGHFIDKINMTGTWNQPAYAQYHTQSPRTTQFNGGAHGGMDDRFDLILISEALNTAGGLDYKPGTMLAFGNDGQHYNQAITDAPVNSNYPTAVITALHQASDHLPVVASFTYHFSGIGFEKLEGEDPIDILNTPTGARLRNPEGQKLSLSVYDLSGHLILKQETNGEPLLSLPSGFFIVSVRGPASQELLLVKKVLNP